MKKEQLKNSLKEIMLLSYNVKKRYQKIIEAKNKNNHRELAKEIEYLKMAIDYENKIYDKVIASPYLEEFETSLNQITCLPVRNIFYENLEISTLDIPLLRPLNYISFLNIWYEKIPVISLEETSEEMIANIQKSFQIANQLNLLKNQKQVLYYDYLLSKQAQYNRKISQYFFI